MSGNPLDGRIRVAVREELQQQITDLHEHLHHAATIIKRLEDRVDALEKAASQAAVAKRAARKPVGSNE